MTFSLMTANDTRPAPARPSLTMAMMDFGDAPGDAQTLRQSLEARGADFIPALPSSEVPADAPWLDADVLLVTARLLDARISALIETVSAKASPFVIVLSETGDFIDRIRALELGADDFLRRDTDPREILARANSLMRRGAQRRGGGAMDAANDDGAWVLNDVSRVLRSPSGTVCELSKGDVKLIGALAEEDIDILSAQKDPAQVNSLRVSISRLRRRFRKVSAEDLPIRNIWGLGYSFDAPLRRVSARS
ncbi:hypothetical protein GCM10009422_26000 [Brevundimonas kwangchunensis]|uniref:Response regulatory domain-containing protein n=1 Tax=Brevundimonas kwangchunensis TaxID=322163 RepID=A0ABN1H345_9CAUL